MIDVTIAYPNGHPLSLLTLSFGSREKCDIAVNYKVYKASDVPFNDDIGLRDWMYKVYEEKDKMLGKKYSFLSKKKTFLLPDNYYKYGAFNPGEKGNRIEFSWYEIIGMYAFWFISFIIQLKLYPWIVYKFFAFLYGY